MRGSVLLVSENPITAKTVRSALEKGGLYVREALDADSALASIARERPSLVLQDLSLPGVDSAALLSRLRERMLGAPVSVVALAGLVSRDEESRIAAAGFDDYVLRPVEPSRLLQIVAAHIAPQVAKSDERFGAGRTLVLADDDPLQAKLGSFLFSKLGFEVVTAPDGGDALDLARLRSPAAIVSDVMMPRVDGFRMCLEARRDQRLGALPIILMTSSYVDEADRQLAHRAGATAYVVRTPDFAAVIAALRDALERTQGAPESGGESPPDDAEVEREHGRRVILQLERQVRANMGVTQSYAMLSAELSILSAISNALASHETVDGALDEVLAASFDAGGISHAVLYVSEAPEKSEAGFRVRAFGGASAWPDAVLRDFFGDASEFAQWLGAMSPRPVALPAEGRAFVHASRALREAHVLSALLLPLVHRSRRFGAILLGSASATARLDDEHRYAFASGIASQITQALALASAFAVQRRSEREANEAATTLRTIMESMVEGVLVADQTGAVVFTNAAAASLFEVDGAPAAERANPGRYRLFLPDKSTPFSEENQPLRRAVRGDAVDHVSAYVRTANGREGAFLSVNGRPLTTDDGQRRGGIVVLRDVTAERAAQEQLMLSDRMVSVGMLAAGVAHEINNPLAAALANLEFATRALAGLEDEGIMSPHIDALRESLRDAREAGDRVRLIVRDLKIFSRAEEEKQTSVDLEKVLESSLRLAWNEISHRARVRKEYDRVPTVEANESRLGQVFLNLLVNAAQSIPEGNADQNAIFIGTHVDPQGRAVVEIRDTGSGIAPDVLKRLFTPFFTTKPAGVGTGLGLAICQRIVTSLGGEITVESTVGRGTAFRVVLPPSKRELVERVEKRPSTRPTRRGRVLVVDDDALIGKAVRRALGSEHDVTVLSSAIDALSRFDEGERYDVILCDLMMPQVTGMDFHAALTERVPEQAARVVFLTGGAFTARAREYLDVVANPRIEKPFEVQNLRTMVNERIR